MRCSSCLFYKNSKCLKMHDDTFESCKSYQRLQEKHTVTVTVQQLKDGEELKEALMNHLNFYRFDRWMFNRLPGLVQY